MQRIDERTAKTGSGRRFLRLALSSVYVFVLATCLAGVGAIFNLLAASTNEPLNRTTLEGIVIGLIAGSVLMVVHIVERIRHPERELAAVRSEVDWAASRWLFYLFMYLVFWLIIWGIKSVIPDG